MISWRNYQNRVKRNRWLRRVAVAFLVLAGVGMVFVLYRSFRWLAAPPLQSDQFWMDRTAWDGKEQLNLWLPREKLVVAFSPLEGTLRYMRVEDRDLTKEVRVPLDAYVFLVNAATKSSGSQEIPNGHDALRFSLVDVGFSQLKAARTNLTRWQLFKFWWKIRGLKESKFIETEDFSETRIRAERLKVMVLNGSGQVGLASEIARWVNNLGAEVIAVDNLEEAEGLNPRGGNEIKAYNLSHDSRTVQRLEQILKTDTEFLESQEAQRADVVITVRETP